MGKQICFTIVWGCAKILPNLKFNINNSVTINNIIIRVVYRRVIDPIQRQTTPAKKKKKIYIYIYNIYYILYPTKTSNKKKITIIKTEIECMNKEL